MSARAAITRRRALALTGALCAAWSGLAPAQTPATATPKSSASPAEKDLVQPTLGDDKDVIAASQRWLKLLDDGHPGAAWDTAAPLLKSAVTRDKWIAGIGAARKPFGTVKSRSPEKFARAHQMPGAPDGDYALVAFQTQFESGKSAEEQITWQLGERDTWRVSGYFIR